MILVIGGAWVGCWKKHQFPRTCVPTTNRFTCSKVLEVTGCIPFVPSPSLFSGRQRRCTKRCPTTPLCHPLCTYASDVEPLEINILEVKMCLNETQILDTIHFRFWSFNLSFSKRALKLNGYKCRWCISWILSTSNARGLQAIVLILYSWQVLLMLNISST